MRNVVLFIAMSLDGYIADTNGKVDWLSGQGNDAENVDTYSDFIQSIDTVVMGWNTYYQVSTELSPSNWVYDAFTSYVITHRPEVSTEKIKFVADSPSNLIEQLKKQCGKDIWVCGGAAIAQKLMQDNLIDRFHISIIPTILGAGIRLFGTLDTELKLKLISTQNYNGITEIVYEKRYISIHAPA